MKKKGNKIGWCDITVNPVTGCEGHCPYCYARGVNEKYGFIKNFSKPEFFPKRMKDFRTKEPLIIFIDSMSDVACWEQDWFMKVASEMYDNNHNIYLALTKNYGQYLNRIHWAKDNTGPTGRHVIENTFLGEDSDVWVGVTVTRTTDNPIMSSCYAYDFISFEPLLEEIEFDISLFYGKWWIIGSQTDKGKPVNMPKIEWVRSICEEAEKRDIPVFMKDSIKELMGDEFVRMFPAEFVEKKSGAVDFSDVINRNLNKQSMKGS